MVGRAEGRQDKRTGAKDHNLEHAKGNRYEKKTSNAPQSVRQASRHTQGQRSTRLSNFGFEQWQMERCTVGERTSASSSMRHDERTLRHSDRQTLDEQAIEIMMAKNTILKLNSHVKKPQLVATLIDARLDMLKRDQMQEQLPKLDHSGSTIIVLVSSLSMVKYYADSADIQRLSATYKVDSFAHDGKAGKPDPWENEEWRRNLFGNEVIIMNSQLLLDGFNAFHINIQQFSMIIFDDFHHCLTHRPYTRILQEHYNRLDPKDVRQLRIVGLTATLLKKNSRDGTERKQSIRGLKRTIDVEVFHLKNADARKMHTTEGFNGGASEDSAQLKQCFDAMLEMSEYFEGFCSLCHMQYGKHDFKNSVPWGVGNVKVQEDYEYVSATWHLGACGVKDVMPSKPDGANMPLCPRHTAWATWKSKVPSQHLSAKTSKLLETLRNPKEHKFTVVVSTPLLCHLLFKVVSDFISQFREGRTHVCCLHKYLSDNKKQEETRAFVRWRSQDSCVLIVDYKSCDIPESPFVIIFDAPSESISSILKDKAFNARVTMMENTSTESQDELYSSKIKLPGGVYFYESEAYNIVENFIRRQPYDTWRPPSSFVTVEKNEDGTREKCIIRLPLSCPMRDPKGSTWKDSMEEARTEACVNCIRVLFDHNLLDNTLQPIEVSKQLLPLALPAQPRKKLPYLLSPKIGRLVDESERITLWRMSYIKNHQAGARPVSSDKVAIITSAFPCESFRVPIKGNDQLFQFEPTAYMWNCELQKLVARFHESLVEAGHELFRQEKGRETAYFCFVKDKANSAKSYQAWQSARMDSVDVSMVPVDRLMMDGFARTKVEDRKEKMARFAVRDADSDPIAVLLQETKHWYPAMLKVIETQAHLAALKRSSPPSEHLIFPVLSAYHLQGVLSPGGKEIVQAIGTGVMSTLMSMFAFTGDHSADVSVLERTVQQRSKVIKDIMKADPNLPAFAKLIHGSFSENHVSFLYTLVGTYFCMDGGGFFQAWNLLEWLTSQGENCKGASKKECSAVLGHYLFGNTEHFLGRTPSYMEFQEVDEDDEKILKVYYEGRGWVDYRRQNMENGRLWPQERFAEYHTPTWKTMKYHPEFKTYVSAWMLDPEEQQRPLPNKVTSWLRGKRCASLTTVKHYMGRTPDYVQLQETPCGKLWVKYQDDAWYCYTRYPNGGIGNEKPSGGDAAPIKYSERFKTFKSPHKDQPLANKIVEWERYKSLALLAVPRKSDDEDPVSGQDTDMHVECPNDDEICWRHEGRRFICYGQRAPGGLVYLEREEGVPHVKPRALIYSEELKTWLSPALTEEGKFPAGFKLPGAVVDWLKKYVQRVIKEPQPTLEMYRHQWMKTPWCVVPSYIKTMVPPQLNLPKIEAEVLRFAFRNPVFLVEALTHESFTQSVSPNYQRLEFIGGPLLDLCITLCLQEKELLSVLSDPKLFQAINHCASSPMAYAIAMADSKMAEHILRQSPKLDEAIEYFVGRLEQCRRPSVPPSRKQKRGDVGSEMSPASRKSTQDDAPFSKDISSFLKIAPCDAPRVLSDVFKALAGAVFLDSDWSTFVKTLKPFVMKFVIHQFFQVSKTGEYIPLKSSDQENIKRYAFPLEDLHSEFSKRDWDVEVEELNVSALRGGNGAKEKRDKIVGTAFQRCSQSSSKVMLAASLQESPDVEKWRDVAFAVGKLNGRIVCRTVATNFQLAQKRALWRMRAILKRSLEDKHIRALVIDSVPHADLEESFIAKLAVDKDAIVSPLRKPTAPLDLEADPVPSQSLDTDESAAVYCSDCEMWLNGPTQWKDHRIGKKHRKNAQRRGCASVDKGDVVGQIQDSGNNEDKKGRNKARPNVQNEVSLLNEWVQHEFGTTEAGAKLLRWEFENEKDSEYTDKGPCFRAVLRVSNERQDTFYGDYMSSKRNAQRNCASRALEELKQRYSCDSTPMNVADANTEHAGVNDDDVGSPGNIDERSVTPQASPKCEAPRGKNHEHGAVIGGVYDSWVDEQERANKNESSRTPRELQPAPSAENDDEGGAKRRKKNSRARQPAKKPPDNQPLWRQSEETQQPCVAPVIDDVTTPRAVDTPRWVEFTPQQHDSSACWSCVSGEKVTSPQWSVEDTSFEHVPSTKLYSPTPSRSNTDVFHHSDGMANWCATSPKDGPEKLWGVHPETAASMLGTDSQQIYRSNETWSSDLFHDSWISQHFDDRGASNSVTTEMAQERMPTGLPAWGHYGDEQVETQYTICNEWLPQDNHVRWQDEGYMVLQYPYDGMGGTEWEQQQHQWM